MQWLILTTLMAGVLAAPMQQSLSVNDDGSYQFYYETGEDAGRHSRTEVRHPDGTVIGKFSYEDANGDIREVSYRADDSGYVANGDVSVEGAPKGQFPAVSEDQNEPQVAPSATEVIRDVDIPEQHTPAPEQDPQPEEHKDEENKVEEDMKVLAMEESSANDPPEGFPPGYFLQSFHGLRRLPEPTMEQPSTTTSKPTTTDKEDHKEDNKEDLKDHQQDKKEDVAQPNAENQDPEPSEDVSKNEMGLFMNLRPFHQSFGPQQVGSSMFRHQPVYVFSYQHPDSYGYHYYF